MKYYNVFRYFAILILSISIIGNLSLAVIYDYEFSYISNGSLYLIALLFCYVKYTNLTTGLLVILNVIFWHQTFTLPEVYSGFPNSIAFYTRSVNSLNHLMGNPINHFIIKTLLSIPVILGILIFLVDVPYRIIR